jgi:FtsZ-binding cell division protein ZapB
MSDLVEHLREHADRMAGDGPSGSAYDPETLALEHDAADRIEALEAEVERLAEENAICRDAIEHCLELVEAWSQDNDDDHSEGVARAQTRRLNEAIGKAVPRLLFERPEGQRFYGLHYRTLREERDEARAEAERLRRELDALQIAHNLLAESYARVQKRIPDPDDLRAVLDAFDPYSVSGPQGRALDAAAERLRATLEVKDE